MATDPLSPIDGYPKLAYHMAKYPDCSIYRRFSSLNCQNLLYFQAELTHLELKLRRFEAADLASVEGNRADYSKDWYWLHNSAAEGNSEQLDTVHAIRATLKEYNDAIIQHSAITRLAEPSAHNLRSLQNWLERTHMGNLALLGKDRHVWGASDERIGRNMDLLTVGVAGETDPFSMWFAQKFIHWFYHMFGHWMKEPDVESGIASYEYETLRTYTSYLATVIASLLPILSILILYYVDVMTVRLGLMALFIVMFTICLLIFTNATRGEIFIATSTFAAVMVVFVSANNASSAST